MELQKAKMNEGFISLSLFNKFFNMFACLSGLNKFLDLFSLPIFSDIFDLLFSKFKIWDVEMGGNGLGYPIQLGINFGINLNF